MEMNFCRFTLLTSYQQREKNKLFQLRFWGYEKCPAVTDGQTYSEAWPKFFFLG